MWACFLVLTQPPLRCVCWWGSVEGLCHGINRPSKHWVKIGAHYPGGPPCFLFQIAFQSFWVLSASIITRFCLVSLLLVVKSSSTNSSVPAAELHLLCWLLSVSLKLLRALSLLFSIITYFKHYVTFGNTSLYNRMQKKIFLIALVVCIFYEAGWCFNLFVWNCDKAKSY